MRFLLVVFLGANIFWREYLALTIASSKLKICESHGKNPHNVVDNKSCEKKLIITQSIQSNQKGGTESLYFRTKKIYDESTKEEARLYYPFIVTLSKSAVNLVYPFYYKASVNNQPYEEIRKKHKCRDEFYADSSATCGYNMDPDGKKIWDSQGFCCACSRYDFVPRWLRYIAFGGHIRRYYRGGQGGLCGYQFIHGQNDKYSHCMRLDNLWYDVFAIGRYRISFTIDVQAYDQVEKVVDNKTITEWVDGGKLVLNYQKRSGVGKHGRLLAYFLGSFPATNELPSLATKYLLIPKRGTSTSDQAHVQTRNGFKDYMIISGEMISLLETANSCDKIGVSYSSFRKQGGGTLSRGAGCEQKKNSCLNNQPKQLFEEDMALREAGSRTNYFVDSYGKCIGVNRKGVAEHLGIVYELDETMTSLITLEVSADDMILIYNRATGVIVKTFATDFDALSRDGKLTVIVQNTGLVTANFYVVFAGCSDGVIINHEKTASINPKSIHSFQYKLDVFMQKGKRHFCEVQLYDSRRYLQDSTNVTFKTYTPCVCLQNCVCKCNAVDTVDVDEDDDGKSCTQPGEEDDEHYDDEDETEESDGNILTKTWEFIIGKIGRGVTITLLLLLLGIVKAVLGRQSLFIAKFGRGGVRTGKRVSKSVKGEMRTLVYNNSMDLVDVTTNEMLVPNNATWDFCVNILFFYLLPVLLVVSVVKAIISFSTLKSNAQRLPVTSSKSQSDSPGASGSERKPKRHHKLAAKMPKFKEIPKLIAHVPKLSPKTK